MTRQMSGFTAGVILMTSTSCQRTAPHPLDHLPRVRLEVHQHPLEVWLAEKPEETSRGLMFITAEQLAPWPDGTERGMLFVFPDSRRESFWMKNTIIPLDIVYLSATGQVVGTHTMAPLDDRWRQYPPEAPYRFALELRAGRLRDWRIKNGDLLTLPDTLLKPTP